MKTRQRLRIIALLVISTSAYCQPPSFCFSPLSSTLPSVPTGSISSFVESGDFNNDGNADLIVANAGENNCMVYFGGGNGTFSLASTFPCNVPAFISVTDFNTDGNSDLVMITDHYKLSISVGKGNGTFVTYTFTAGSVLSAVVCADFDADNKIDIAAVDINLSQLLMFTGDGSGGFYSTKQYIPTGYNPSDMTSGDFDGNGIIDLAIVHSQVAKLSVFYGLGNGTFKHRSFPLKYTAYTIAAADFNHDGLWDIALAGSNVIYEMMSTGEESFSSPVGHTINQIQIDLVTGDFNGDNHPDIGCCNYGGHTAAFLAGIGNGLFGNPEFYSVNTGPINIIRSDFNNDSIQDVAVLNLNANNVSILLNGSPNIKIKGPSILCSGQNTTLTASGAVSYKWSEVDTTSIIELKPTVSQTYTVSGKNGLGCTSTTEFTLKVENCSSINTFDNNYGLNFYPNPASDQLFLDCHTNCEVSLINIEGEVLIRQSLLADSKVSLNLSSLVQGLYFLEVQTADNISISKLLIQ